MDSTVGSTSPHDWGRLERWHFINVVAGIEGRSVVGNLRIVISRYVLILGWVCLGPFAQCPSAVAQQPADAKPAAAAPAAAATPAPAADAAAPAGEAPAAGAEAKPAESGGQIRSKIEYAEPLMASADERATRSKLTLPFQRAQKSIAPTNAEKKVLEDHARFSVDRMTMVEHRSDLFRLVIDPARRSAEGQLTTPAAKAIILKALNDRCLELLNQKPVFHPDVQLGLVILLTSMNADSPTNKTPVPYTAGFRSVIQVLENSELPLQCRIIAAAGLGRFAKDAAVGIPGGDITAVQRNEIAAGLTKVLLASDSEGEDEGKQWFRERLAESLGECGLAFDLNGGSGPIDALMKIATNPAESLRVRAAAMRAATQTAWNAQTNVPLILHEIMKLVAEIAKANDAVVDENIKLAGEAARRNDEAKAKDPKHKAVPAVQKMLPASLSHANLDVYFCFVPETSAHVNLKYGLVYQVTRSGLTQHAPLVDSGYKLAMPLFNHVLTYKSAPRPFPKVNVDEIDKWLKANAPADRKVTPVSPVALP